MTSVHSKWAWGERHRTAVIAGALLLVLALLLGTTPWVGEDAHITLRTVENFLRGDGLRWNLDERVQTYTHPLWLFLVSFCYVLTREWYFTLTVLALVLSLGALLVQTRRLPEVPGLLLAGLFCASRALVNFATSGFETSLTLFLVSWFVVALRPRPSGQPPAWGLLSLIAALGMLNRLDLAVLFAPVFVYLVVRWRPGPRELGRAFFGAAPVWGWLLFSLVYYGFLAPNTAPAKLSPYVSLGSYLHTGVRDLVALLRSDPGGGFVLLLGVVAAILAIVSFARTPRERRDGWLAALGVGLLCQIAYTIRVGGDFIIGRFWVPQLWLSLLLVAHQAEAVWDRLAPSSVSRRLGLLLCGGLAVAGVQLGVVLALSPFYFGPSAVQSWRGDGSPQYRSDARAELRADLTWVLTPLAVKWQNEGREAQQRLRETGVRVHIALAIGFTGLAAGRDVVIVDPYALGDPLLARLPPKHRQLRLAGHLVRWLPRGYLHARETGSTDQIAPEMRAYYEALRLVVSGPIFSVARFRAIAALNLRTLTPPAQYEVEVPPGAPSLSNGAP